MSKQIFSVEHLTKSKNSIKRKMTESSLINPLLKNKADILRTLCYPDIAAHLISRGVLSMQEHRLIFVLPDEVARANKLLEILSQRDNAIKHLVDGMQDSELDGKYAQLVKLLEVHLLADA